MPKNKVSSDTFMNKNEAVVNLFLSVMVSDGNVSDSEIAVIEDFIGNLHSFDVNLEASVKKISSLTPEEISSLFDESIVFLKDIPMDEKILLLDKINDIIEADGIIAEGETNMLMKINSIWNFD